MNSDVAESRPRTKTPAAKEFETIEIAGPLSVQNRKASIKPHCKIQY